MTCFNRSRLGESSRLRLDESSGLRLDESGTVRILLGDVCGKITLYYEQKTSLKTSQTFQYGISTWHFSAAGAALGK